jgi:5-methylcytosine-specific restriction endonuclease McrA
MNVILDRPVLVLNRLWQPVHTCSARRALKLVCVGHAQIVQTEGEAQYQTHDFGSWLEYSAVAVAKEMVHTVQLALRVPKIIVLAFYDRLPRKEVKFTRHNVFLRDKFICQWCGNNFSERELNLDHVHPRDKGGKTTWENIVTSCIGCNTRKANKLAHEVNMKLLKEPSTPRWRPLFGMRSDVPADESWRQFLHPDREKVKLSA